MAAIDDGALWRRAQHGDEASFGLLFERHAAALHRDCFRRTCDWSQAEDLTSATFLQSWRHRARVQLAASEVLPWLYGVATNLARNSARSRRRYAAAIARIPRELPDEDLSDAATERVASEQRVRELLSSLKQLPVRELEAVAPVWQELSHAEGRVCPQRSRVLASRGALAASTSS